MIQPAPPSKTHSAGECVAAPVRSDRAYALARASLIALAVGLTLLGAGCGGSPSALDTHGPAAARIATLWWIMLALAAAIYAGVLALFVYAARHGRRRADASDPAAGRRFILYGGVLLPVLVLTFLTGLTLRALHAFSVNETPALSIGVVGHDWWWEVQYPDQGFVTANEIHIPAGRPVRLTLTAEDVIHSFWVPQLHGKIDTIPGHVNAITIQANQPGTYRGQCAEFCGLQHAHMVFYVIAEPPTLFAAWVASQQPPAAAPAEASAQAGLRLFQSAGCASCHGVRGTSATGSAAPDLTHLASRRTIAAGTLANTPEKLLAWIQSPASVKSGARMPPSPLSAADLQTLVAYLETLK